MSKRKLLNLDLISINCVDPYQSAAAINYCQKYFEFGKSILVTHQDVDVYDIELHIIDKLDWYQYNDHVLNLIEHTDNDYVMLIQDDGHPINPELWDDEYLEYDYIGAPWPSEESWISLQHKDQQDYIRKNFPKNRVGNGGFCIRSRKFLKFSTQYGSCNGLGEDSFLCTRKYEEAIEYGIKFAPFELSSKFSYENPCIEFGTSWNQQMVFDRTKHFGWHGKNFLNTHELMSLKYT
jgi:hypothetical protein